MDNQYDVYEWVGLVNIQWIQVRRKKYNHLRGLVSVCMPEDEYAVIFE